MPTNIIHFHAESWDGRMLGMLGHPALRHATPNIDRLAAEGTQFERAYCTHPICCPSRANMWSGRYTHNCESWNNNKGLETGMWCLLDHLPRSHTLKTLGKLDYLTGAHTVMNRVADWLACSGVDKPVFDECYSQNHTVADDRNVRCHASDWQRLDEAIAFLEGQVAQQRQGDAKPFFLTFSSGLVHPKFHTNRYWLDKIPEEAVDCPPPDASDHPCIRYQRLTKGWRYGFDDATVRRVRRIYLAMCAEGDAIVGALVDAMKRLGLDADTYFVFTSDHGELALEHQDWYKMSLYEGSVRVPLIVAGPGVLPGQRLANLVSLIDLCPTFMELAGLPPRADCDGESLVPLLTGATRASRDSAYACYMGLTMNTSAFMLRQGRWKYIAYVGYPCQLFDIEADPGELDDCSARHPDVVRRLDADLRAIVDCEQTHRDLLAYNKEAFRQWRRQAKRGLFVDASYGLAQGPSSDYMTLMDNTFTGYNADDEAKVDAWLQQAP